MIGFFTDANEDELLYSQLARYYVRTGYMFYRAIADDLFVDVQARPNIEYFTRLTDEALQMITRNKSLEKVIMQNTMYPYYARFYPQYIKQVALNDLIKMTGNISNILTGSKKRYGEERYLRYCPVCVKEMRERGELYWRRRDQLVGVSVCPQHRCYLHNSDVLITGARALSLITAEEAITDVGEVRYATNDLEWRISKYVTDVFFSDLDMKTDSNIGQFLHSKLANTKYVSSRGQQRNMKLLVKDFNEYYGEIGEKTLCEEWQFHKIFNGKSWNTYHICLLAIFLNLTVDELLEMRLPERRAEEIFDETVIRLRQEGQTYAEIARILQTKAHMVKAICANEYLIKKPKSESPKKTGRTKWDWEKIDEETLPMVKKAIEEMRGDEYTRPQKITVLGVEKKLDMPCKRITSKLPKCMTEILKHQEPIEVYWAREVIWAVNTIRRQRQTLNWRHIRDLTNMRNIDLAACYPHLTQMTDTDTTEGIRKILNELSDRRKEGE
ncbi:MAG: TniQ family protein [Clostridia bacterium]|nr:TniQ family protein [Clostridia bacterium]